jgi:hypothetical protein
MFGSRPGLVRQQFGIHLLTYHEYTDAGGYDSARVPTELERFGESQ